MVPPQDKLKFTGIKRTTFQWSKMSIYNFPPIMAYILNFLPQIVYKRRLSFCCRLLRDSLPQVVYKELLIFSIQTPFLSRLSIGSPFHRSSIKPTPLQLGYEKFNSFQIYVHHKKLSKTGVFDLLLVGFIPKDLSLVYLFI